MISDRVESGRHILISVAGIIIPRRPHTEFSIPIPIAITTGDKCGVIVFGKFIENVPVNKRIHVDVFRIGINPLWYGGLKSVQKGIVGLHQGGDRFLTQILSLWLFVGQVDSCRGFVAIVTVAVAVLLLDLKQHAAVFVVYVDPFFSDLNLFGKQIVALILPV